ncbi:NUDIX hydrolase [Fusobacterium sp. MFO224]|uniref:NUDIX hydrolase n=1 Tax=Fusobacterium sp. MFO224 TaxID=3378070 RepID=UPI003851AA2E
MEKFLSSDKCETIIIGSERNINSSVLVLFCEIDGEINILFEKRAESISQGGEVSFPGGVRDKKDKFSMETALRETFEEIGIRPERIKRRREYGTLVIPTGVIIQVNVGYIDNFSFEELKLNKDEVEKVFFVPLEYFMKNKPIIEEIMVENVPSFNKNGKNINFPAKELGLPSMYNEPWGKERRVFLYPYNGEMIWGITGEIIDSICKNIKKIIDM